MQHDANQPLVSIGLAVWNGETFLTQTLESLVAQTYQNIEIIILDNRSTDQTSAICQQFAKKDSRIRYILDDIPRDVMQAQKKVAHLAAGTFFMTVCDDDFYESNYISTLMDFLLLNPKTGLAYSGVDFIHSDGTKTRSNMNKLLSQDRSTFRNFIYYLFFRNPIPIVFGIIRIENHKDALTYFNRADHRGWNHDNLYVLRLLSMVPVHGTRQILFYYRQQDRYALYKKRGQLHQPVGFAASYLNNTLHQISVTRAVVKIIRESKFSTNQKQTLYLYNYIVLIYRIGPKYLVDRLMKYSSIRKLKQKYL